MHLKPQSFFPESQVQSCMITWNKHNKDCLTLSSSNHWCALTAIWVPRGLVRTNTSPTTAFSGLIKEQSYSKLVTTWEQGLRLHTNHAHVHVYHTNLLGCTNVRSPASSGHKESWWNGRPNCVRHIQYVHHLKRDSHVDFHTEHLLCWGWGGRGDWWGSMSVFSKVD